MSSNNQCADAPMELPGALQTAAGAHAKDSPIRFDRSTLWPDAPGRRFNPSILADGDGYLFAFRNEWWGSDIYIGRLDEHLQPTGAPRRLALEHSDADVAREDPRLFRFRGRPHLAFTGHKHGDHAPSHNQLYARLAPDGMAAEEVFAPHFPARQRWEKNWSFFENGGELFAVYSFAPCRILRIDGNAANLAYETGNTAAWPGGEIRGGAPPVRVAGELWCFTHDHVMRRVRRDYRTGLVILNTNPPFEVRRMVPVPILVADPATKPTNQYASVVFPGGAVRCGDDWIVAHGIHDHWCELHRFSHAELEARLVPVS